MRLGVDRRALLALNVVAIATTSFGGEVQPNHLYPDMFPYVDPNARAGLETLQDWRLNGTTLSFDTLFANRGDGLFEIRRGPQVEPDRYVLLQRVYINTDFGQEFQDIPIGTAPIPLSGNPVVPPPYSNQSNLIWFEDFAHFSLHEAPIVDGMLTVGDEVAGGTKSSWRLSGNIGSPLPGFEGAPNYFSTDQSIEQRISVGWADIYSAGSLGQSFDITGVPIGPRYWLRQTVDPENRVIETDETNNSFEVLIDLNSPGEAFMIGNRFLQPGDAPPVAPGDLTEDGVVDLHDWLAFKAVQGTPLDGLDDADRLALGDLNLDGQHTLSDAVLFRQYYDQQNGAGAFAALTSNIPEPSTLLIAGFGSAAVLVGRRRMRRVLLIGFGLIGYGAASTARVADARVVIFSEDFEGLPLRNSQSASEIFGSDVWTDAAPAGWSRDNRNTPAGDPDEFFGWTFVDKSWWVNTADDQQRSGFSGGMGTVAVADPDEYDDLTNIDPDQFSASLTTPVIDLGAAAPGAATLRFNSSWRPEDTQHAALFASIDGGAPLEVYRWTSSGANFKPDGTDEVILVGGSVVDSGQTDYAFDLNPAGASTLQLIFDMPQAGNDWWWAIDNLELFTPSTLQVDVASGQMTILGGEDITGYQITSPSGSLDPSGWIDGNLDAQNYGAPVPATTDRNNDGVVDAADYTLLRDSGAPPTEIGTWASEYGSAVGLGASWETLIAEDDQLLEFLLEGASTFEQVSLGSGFETVGGQQDLRFTYSIADGTEFQGSVQYLLPTATQTPEPTGCLAAAAAILATAGWPPRPGRSACYEGYRTCSRRGTSC